MLWNPKLFLILGIICVSRGRPNLHAGISVLTFQDDSFLDEEKINKVDSAMVEAINKVT